MFFISQWSRLPTCNYRFRLLARIVFLSIFIDDNINSSGVVTIKTLRGMKKRLFLTKLKRHVCGPTYH
jgi:hypothetical protein